MVVVIVIVIKIVMCELITEQGAEKDQGQAFQLVRGLHPGGKPDHHDMAMAMVKIIIMMMAMVMVKIIMIIVAMMEG